MRVLIQRVIYTEVHINNILHSSINKGLLLFLGIEDTDTIIDIDWLINKIQHLRIFSDLNDQMNLSITDLKGEIMIVSQFTLYASIKKGTRPGFTNAAKPDYAKYMYDLFIHKMACDSLLNIKSGVFGANMEIKLLNDGPVTIFIDTKNKE